jgi:hypothetical protein
MYCENGMFYDYLIRKHIYNIKKEDGYDRRSEEMKKTRFSGEDLLDEDLGENIYVYRVVKDFDYHEVNKHLKLCLEDYEKY